VLCRTPTAVESGAGDDEMRRISPAIWRRWRESRRRRGRGRGRKPGKVSVSGRDLRMCIECTGGMEVYR